MSRLVKLAPAAIALTFALGASAGLKSSEKPAPVVKFKAVGTAPGLSIDGSGDKLTVSEDGGKIVARASLCNLKTGIGLRDKHTRTYLKVDCSEKDPKKWVNPNAILKVEKSKINVPADGKSSSGTVTGRFTIAGVEKDQAFTYDVKNTGGAYAVKGTIKLKITDYTGGDEPSYLGVGVDPNIVVSVSFTLQDG